MHRFYIANACFILEFMSYIILNVCAKIGETLDMKTKSRLHVLQFLFRIVKIVALSWIYDTWWVPSGYWLGITGKKIEDNNRSFEKWKMFAPSKIVMFSETPTHCIMPCNVPCKYKRKKWLQFYKLPHLLPNEVRTDRNWSLEASHNLWCEVHNIYFALVCLFP